MSYTPVELRHVHVGRRPFGYHRAAVQKVLDDVADSFEIVWRDRLELADRVEQLEQEVDALKSREQALANTLVVAEHAADETRVRAKREAELVVSEAHAEARAILRDAHSERERLQSEVRRIESLLRSALALLGESDTATVIEPAEEFHTIDEPAGYPTQVESVTPVRPELAPAQEPAEETGDPIAEETPGWPPLRKVAQGRRDFDWGD